MELETMKFIVKQSIVTKNLCRFADDQIRFNQNVVKAINRYRKGSLCLCASVALLWLAESASQKKIKKLEQEIASLKNKDGTFEPEPGYFNDTPDCHIDPVKDCFDVKLP